MTSEKVIEAATTEFCEWLTGKHGAFGYAAADTPEIVAAADEIYRNHFAGYGELVEALEVADHMLDCLMDNASDPHRYEMWRNQVDAAKAKVKAAIAIAERKDQR